MLYLGEMFTVLPHLGICRIPLLPGCRQLARQRVLFSRYGGNLLVRFRQLGRKSWIGRRPRFRLRGQNNCFWLGERSWLSWQSEPHPGNYENCECGQRRANRKHWIGQETPSWSPRPNRCQRVLGKYNSLPPSTLKKTLCACCFL